MDQPRYISVAEAVAKLSQTPDATIRQQRADLNRHMTNLKRGNTVVSLAEYSKFYRARRILDQVLEKRLYG